MSVSDPLIEEGELLAYLAGEQLPRVEQALRASPELRQQLDTLRLAQSVFVQAFSGISRADPQDMVDVALGQATPTQELRVAAYLRASASGREEMRLLKAELQSFAMPVRRRIPRLPSFFAMPMMGGAGTRSGGVAQSTSQPVADRPPAVRAEAFERTEQSFYAAALDAQVALQILPPQRERWQIQGRVTQQGQPMLSARVTLRAQDHRPRPRNTDAGGFFRFDRLPPGTYRLQVTFEQGLLLIPEIILSDD